MRRLHPDWEVYSAGARPRGSVNPLAIVVMREVGIDIQGQRPKEIRDLPVCEFDAVINLGCPHYPLVLTANYAVWQIPELDGRSARILRQIRDRLYNEVQTLVHSVEARTRPRTRRVGSGRAALRRILRLPVSQPGIPGLVPVS